MSFRNFIFEGIGHISIENFGSGSITVEPGSQEGTVEGSLNASDQSFLDAIEVEQNQQHLRVELPHRFSLSSPVHLRLGVPAGLSYVIQSGSADVSVLAEIGRAKIGTGSGDVRLGSVTDLDCTAGSGDISVDRLEGGSARVTTGSGDVLIAAADGPLQAKSGSGDLLIRELRSDLKANSGSGDIAVASTWGSVDIRSASGSITVGIADALPAWLDLDSVSGNIRIALDPGSQPAKGEPFVSVRARTASGEIAVYRS